MIERILRLSTNNPVLVNVLFLVICAAGILSWNLLPKERFPHVQVDRVVGVVFWPGAGAEDVEDLLLRPMEDTTQSVEGIKHMYGTALPGKALLTLELNRGHNVDKALTDLERQLNQLDLPEDATPPIALIIRLRIPIIQVALQGDIRAVEQAEDLRKALHAIPGVRDVWVQGQATRVLRVDLQPEKIQASGLSSSDIVGLIKAANQAAPAGTLDNGTQQAVIRSPRQLHNLEDIQQILIPLPGSRGPPVALSSLGRIYEDWEAPEEPIYVNGLPAITFKLLRNDDADTIEVAKNVRHWAQQQQLPNGLKISCVDDSSLMVDHGIRTLGYNAFIGLVLVAAFLSLFIGFRNTALVIWGMPVAYLGAIALMYATHTTINTVSVFSLLLVTGIIVDDAVIIVENVQRHLEYGKDRVQAAIDGTKEVCPAVLASTITTCLAFAPLLMLEGTMGQVMTVIPLVVIFALGSSILEAFFILPGHLGHYAEEHQQQQGENKLSRHIKTLCQPLIERITQGKNRYIILAAVAVIFVLTFSLTQIMRTSLNTDGHPYFAFVNIDLPEGSSITETNRVLRQLEEQLLTEEKETIWWTVGMSGIQPNPRDFATTGPRYGQLKVGFRNSPKHFKEVPALLDRLRTSLHHNHNISSFAIETIKSGPPTGRDIDIKLRSRNPNDLYPALALLKEFFHQREAMFDIRDEAVAGSWEYRIHLEKEQASQLGITEAHVALAARSAIDGELAIELPVQERKTELRIRIAGIQQADQQQLGDIPISRLPNGETIRLRQVASLQRNRSIERIQRVDRQRALRISALVNPKQSSAEEEQQHIQAFFDNKIKPQFPEMSIFYGGGLDDSRESLSSLPSIFTIAILLIYAVLAVQFRSYLQPFIILSAIPLSLIGVILGLFSLGMDLSLVAMVGSIGLTGIVVNDALILIDFINQQRANGMELKEAVVSATLTRLRPILITTVTTVLGLAPLGFGLAGEEPMLAPMAVSISFGLTFATVLSLMVVPTLYLVIEDIKSMTSWSLQSIGLRPKTSSYPSDTSVKPS